MTPGERRLVRLWEWALWGAFCGALACSGAGETRGDKPAKLAPLEALLPGDADRFAPALTRVATDARTPARVPISGDKLTRIDSCKRCHADIVQQWSSSAHAFASFNNPIYRLSIDGFRERVDRPRSRFCAGCHDIALLVDQAMDQPVEAADARAHAGVNCRVCHGVVSATADGNGSFELARIAVPVPNTDDPASVAKHRRAVSVRALGSDLCRTCHRSFVGTETGNAHHLRGMDDFSDWQQSAHAGNGVGRVDAPIEARDCIDCHMPKESASSAEAAAGDGTVSSHRFLGGHTWLGAMRADESYTQRVAEQLRGVASIDIAQVVSYPPEPSAEERADAGRANPQGRGNNPPKPPIRTLLAAGAPVLANGRLALDVVVRNLSVGHRLPGGVKDAQDVWLEVTVRDRNGQLIGESGLGHASDPDDLDTHVLRALMADERGALLFGREVDRFAASIVDHSLAPRDATVVRYDLEVPTVVATPLEVRARLLHRSRNLRLQRAACADYESERSRAFTRAGAELRGASLDPCVPQPVTTIAQTRVSIGDGTVPTMAPNSWRRLYEHGLAWTHAVQERLDEARPSLLAALAELDRDPDAAARDRAAVLTALGRLAGRQGRTDEALEFLDRADALVPEHPAVAAARGAALTRVWRWREAESPLTLAADKAPDNASTWAALAIALGSLGRDRDALVAAQKGLVLEPRHAALLRVQALSLRALGAASADAALDAYDRFRKPDRAMDIRFACAARSVHCAREREPVHVHRLHPPAARQ